MAAIAHAIQEMLVEIVEVRVGCTVEPRQWAGRQKRTRFQFFEPSFYRPAISKVVSHPVLSGSRPCVHRLGGELFHLDYLSMVSDGQIAA